MTTDNDFHFTTMTVPESTFEGGISLLPFIAALGASPVADEMMRARESAKKAPDTVVIFDTETTGLSASWDQILQLAALRLNRDLEIESPWADIFNARCRIRPDVIPSPKALLTTRVSPAMLDNAPLSHAELMVEVEMFLHDSSPAIFVGHNIQRFDSPHLRHNLFSALLPPYPLQAPGCRMVDTLRLAHLIFALAPEVMVFPTGANGKVSFKLGDLCAANGISLDEADAHDALADVRATLELLKVLREASPTIYTYALAISDKSFVTELIGKHAVLGQIGVYGCTASVMPLTALADDPANPNATIAIDLRKDPKGYLGLSEDDLLDLLDSRASPIKIIRRNASPLLIPLCLLDPMAPASAQKLHSLDTGGDPTEADAELQCRAALVRADRAFRQRVLNVLTRRNAARETSPHVEEQLYSGGFARNSDFALTRRFLALPPAERAALIPSIRDERLKTHAARIVHAEVPETLNTDTRDRMDIWLREKLTATEDVAWMTIQKALDETESLRRDITDSADRIACQLFLDPRPTVWCNETGAWLEDAEAHEEVERSRAAFIEARVGIDLVLLDDYESWLIAKLEALQQL